MTTQSWMLWPENPGAFVLRPRRSLALVFLYAARKPMHELLRAVGALHRRPAAPRRALAGHHRAADEAAQPGGAAGAWAPWKSGSASSASSSASAPWCAATCRAIRTCSASCSTRSRASRRTTRSAAKCRRRRRTGSRPSPRWPMSRAAARWSSDPGGDQALDRQDPRQGHRRVPPLLRVAAQDPRGLHAVLALGRPEH